MLSRRSKSDLCNLDVPELQTAQASELSAKSAQSCHLLIGAKPAQGFARRVSAWIFHLPSDPSTPEITRQI